MKKILLFSLMVLAFVACKKKDEATDPQNPQTDAREAFVGTYDLTINCVFRASTGNETIDAMLPDSIPYTYNGEITIEKDANDAAKVTVSSSVYNCSALVAGNHLMLESENNPDMQVDLGAITGLPILQGVTLPLSYSLVHGTADLNGNTLTWHSDATGSGSVNVLTYALTFSGSGMLDNTATKRAN